ncbi:hypothetical protein [Aliivibrio kagoshimensis]|uniref:hypothetical protein n=1 Tax=Aliivibrio kagoshimensis TaxID=2910230 RepID=UPI003D09DB8F
MSYETKESNFTQILNNYYGVTEQERQWKVTCAALELMKHTLSGNVHGFTENERVLDIAQSIRDSLEHSTE